MSNEPLPAPPRWTPVLPALLLLGAVCWLGWPSLRFPYVQDDWGWMELFAFRSPSSTLRWAFQPEGRLLYRPLGALYHWLMYTCFGVDAFWPRVIALVVTWLGALALVPVGRALTGDRTLAWLAALFFALAATVRMDSILFQVGIKELGASAFGLLACALWLRGRRGSALAAFAAALLTKETALSLIGWMALYEFMIGRAPGEPWRRTWRRVAPLLGLLALYALVRLPSRSPVDLPEGHLYNLTGDPGRLGRHLWFYGQWLLYAICPWLAEVYESPALLEFIKVHRTAITLVALHLVAGLAALTLWLIARPRRTTAGAASALTLGVFLADGVVAGLAPVLPLAHLSFRYYLTFSLPAFFLLVLLVGRRLLTPRCGQRLAMAVLAAYAVLCSAQQIRFFHARCAEGLDQEYWFGTCSLVKDAAAVSIVERDLRRLHPTLPPGCVLIFDNVDIWGLWQDSAVRVWYGDNTIDVFLWKYVSRDDRGWFVKNPRFRLETIMTPPAGVRIDVDLARTYFFRLRDGRLEEFRPEE